MGGRAHWDAELDRFCEGGGASLNLPLPRVHLDDRLKLGTWGGQVLLETNFSIIATSSGCGGGHGVLLEERLVW